MYFQRVTGKTLVSPAPPYVPLVRAGRHEIRVLSSCQHTNHRVDVLFNVSFVWTEINTSLDTGMVSGAAFKLGFWHPGLMEVAVL